MKLAIKIDIDTLKGYLEGLPRLLDILKAHSVKASIFFSFGPDNSGKALRRIFRKGFITKMLRTKAPTSYGIKTLFYGTLLPAPMIVPANPDLLLRAIDEGHDCGVHSWDHVYWQDKLPKLSREQIHSELSKAIDMYQKITGTLPKSCAAPGWQVTPESLSVQDSLGFDYCSDVRGFCPFIPEMSGHTFKTPQVPSTLPTMDEVLGVVPAEKLNAYYFGLMHEGLNVHTIHTEMEGGRMAGTFSEFLDICRDNNVGFMTLREALTQSKLAVSKIIAGNLPGRAGTLAVQVNTNTTATH